MLAYALIIFILLEIQAPKIFIVLACLGFSSNVFKAVKIARRDYSEIEL